MRDRKCQNFFDFEKAISQKFWLLIDYCSDYVTTFPDFIPADNYLFPWSMFLKIIVTQKKHTPDKYVTFYRFSISLIKFNLKLDMQWLTL